MLAAIAKTRKCHGPRLRGLQGCTYQEQSCLSDIAAVARKPARTATDGEYKDRQTCLSVASRFPEPEQEQIMVAYAHARGWLLRATLALLVMPLQPVLAEALTWSDVPCGESRLLVADGFRCRTTAPYSPDNGGGATYRIHTADVTNNEGTTYLYLMEGIDAQSPIRLSRAVPEQLSQAIPLAQTGRDWSEVRLHAGSGYALFTAENGDNCVGFRKAGPARGGGHAWAILGIRCAAKGQTLSDNDIVSAIEAARPNEPARTK